MAEPDKDLGRQPGDAQGQGAGRAGNPPGGQGKAQDETGQYGEIEAVASAVGLDPYDAGDEESVGSEMSIAGQGAEASLNYDPQDEAGNPEDLGEAADGIQPDEKGQA